MTTARYYTPSGRSIQATGITPDVIVPSDNKNGKGRSAAGIKEADLKNHLSNPTQAEETGQTSAPSAPQDKSEEGEKPETTPDSADSPADNSDIQLEKDTQLRSALNVLKELITDSAADNKKRAVPSGE
jgi:carboxyl-terminal processing protease